ncbi:MurR/RpiR family transcriptional regulator [Clostridium sp.]|uniref:MurR/RpiR family transcriptional regulator n=1 Tax=Clostridium sp. TaxID=1506 RepID=UPI003F2BACBC
MKILDKLNNPEIKLTKSQESLTKYMKENIEDVAYKSISEIAKENGVGDATITRFVKRFGFNSFQEFKLTIAKETYGEREENIINPSITQEDGINEVASKLVKSSVEVLENNLKILDTNKINYCIDKILNANKVYFIGIGYSGNIAMEASYKFMRIGLNCNGLADGHTMIMLSSIMNKDDLVISISHTGDTKEIITASKLAKENNVTVIGITSNEKSELNEISDVVIPYTSNESLFETGSLSTKTAQMFLLDLIYTQVVKSRFSESVDKKLKTTRAIKSSI